MANYEPHRQAVKSTHPTEWPRYGLPIFTLILWEESVIKISHRFTRCSNGLHHPPPLAPILHPRAAVLEAHSWKPCHGSCLVSQLRVLVAGSWVLRKANICQRPAYVRWDLAPAGRAILFPLDCVSFWREQQKSLLQKFVKICYRAIWGGPLVKQGLQIGTKVSVKQYMN